MPPGVFEVDVEPRTHVRPLGRGAAEAAATAKAAAAPAKHLAQDVVQVDTVELGAGAAEAVLRARPAATTAETAAVERVIAARGVTPIGVDLAAVELLALVLVADQVEGGGDAFELLLGGLVALVLVGVVLFGQLAEGATDLVRAGRARHAEFLIGVLRQGCSGPLV